MATIKLVPSGTTGASNFSFSSSYPASNAYKDTSSTNNYARCNLGRSTTGYIYFTFDTSDIPSTATITSVTAKARLRISGTSNVTNRVCQLYTNTTAKGSNTDFSSTSSGGSVVTLTPGNWTRTELNNLRLRIGGTGANTNSSRYIYVYGAEVEVTYTTYTVTATSNVSGVTIEPATQSIAQGDSAEIIINTNDISNYILTDNNVDVTSSVVYHQDAGGSHTDDNVLGTYTLVSGGFNSSGATYFQGLVGKGHNSSTTTSNYYSSGSGTIAVFTYDVSFNDIPSNATITSCYAMVNGHAESTSNSNEYMCAQIRSGNTELSSELNFKSVGTSNSTQTITCTTTPTIAQLENLQLYCRLGYYGGALNGATVYVEYTTPAGYYYTYTIANVMGAHTVVLDEASGPYIPDPEDPQKTYYSLTLSSINAITSIDNENVSGTIRVEEGSNETVVITPSDPQLTLALDNGVDITSQLVGGVPSNTYTVTTQVSGASYGFNLNNSTGYYVSTNNGVSKSASVARINMDFDSDCLVTITYINYAEANYDYGMFGKLDTTVATDGLTASSGSSIPSDSTSNYQLAMCSNSSGTQTITYNVPAGNHFIDVKYGKDDASDDNNDSLQWKITNVEATSAGGSYTYTLTNITQKHSLIFIFGDVTYYFITSSIAGAGRIFPDGQQVVLPGDSYRINIVPDNYQATVTMTDNGVNVTSQLESETGQDKQGNTVTSYKYTLSNIQIAHNLIVSIGGASIKLYIKQNGSWVQYSKVYRKINGSWVEQSDISSVFNTNANYIKGN